MSGAQTSTFADQNKLLEANALQLQNYYAPERNRLLNATAEQNLVTARQAAAGTEMEHMGRASQGLLAIPDEQARAAAYPGVVAQLQQYGFAKNAPTSYPGEAALKQIVANSLPVDKQFDLGLAGTSGLSDQLLKIYGGGGGGPPGQAVPGGAYGQGGANASYKPRRSCRTSKRRRRVPAFRLTC